MTHIDDEKSFLLSLLAVGSETCVFGTPEGGTRGIHLAFRTDNVVKMVIEGCDDHLDDDK